MPAARTGKLRSGGDVRVLWLSGILLIAACGGRQSSRPTTVHSGGANVPTDASVESPSSAEFDAVADEPVDLEAFAREPSIEETDVVTGEPPPRDVKMMSYEEAMTLPIEMGDATREGGEAQLSAAEVARLMDSHLDDMYEECIRKELERGNELGTVTMDLAIRGEDGMILGVTIEPGRRRFKKCLESYVEDVRFPTFASPRMGARYRFHAS